MPLTAAELRAEYSVDEGPLDKSLSGLPGKIKGGVAALAGTGLLLGGVIGGGINTGMENERLQDKLSAQLGAGSPLAEAAGQVAGRLYANAYGSSLGEVNDAVRAVLQGGLLPEDATNAQIEAITGRVMDLATTFDQDLGGTTNAVAQMIRTGLAGSAEEALDVLTRGFQQGDDKAGDLLDTINEYGVQFDKLGLDGTAAMGLISQGLKAGARDSDLVADAIKEFSIRAVDGSDTTAAAFEGIGLDADAMSEKIAAGGPTATAALGQVLDGLRGVEDPAKRAQLAVGLFGTQAEDLGAALYALDTDTAVQQMGNVEGAAAKMGKELNDNASTNLESFKRQAQDALVNFLGGKALPAVSSVASTLTTEFRPALDAASGVMTGTVLPAAQAVFGFLGDHQTTVAVIAGLIGGVLVAALGVWAVQSTIAAAANTAAWFSTALASEASSVAQSRSALQVVVGWIGMGVRAAASAAVVVAQYVWMGVQATASAAVTTAAWVGAQIRTVASLVVMAAGFAAQGAVMVASAAVTAAGVVAGWVVMGTQSLIQAARMAAAWFIALGPIGWVTAAVIGLVALIIANWDTVKRVTGQAWDWVWGKIQWVAGVIVTWFMNWTLPGLIIGHWSTIKSAFSNGVDAAVGFVRGLPGRAAAAVANTGSMLYSAGSDLLMGMVRGVSSVSGRVAEAAKDAARAAVNGVKNFLGIHSPSTVFAAIGENVGQGFVNGIAGMRPAVAAEMLRMADTQALAGLTARTPTISLGRAAGGAAAGAADAAQGGIGELVHIDNLHMPEKATANDIAQKLAVLARTGGAG